MFYNALKGVFIRELPSFAKAKEGSFFNYLGEYTIFIYQKSGKFTVCFPEKHFFP